MIVDFTFGNFRSFKEPATLSLAAASKLQADLELDTANTFAVPGRPNLTLLRVAAVYGPNASGKSNFILAMRAFQRMVVQSADSKFVFAENPFLFDKDNHSNPHTFELTFVMDGVQYRYGCDIANDPSIPSFDFEITSEWLYRATSARESLLFERTGDTIKRGHTFSEGAALLKVGKLKRKTALFLSLAAQVGEPLSAALVSYINKNLRIVSGLDDQDLRNYTQNCLEESRYTDTILQLLQGADTGISDIHVLDEKQIAESVMIVAGIGEVQAELRQQIIDSAIASIHESARIQVEHLVFDGSGQQTGSCMMAMTSYESEGTKKLFAFAGPIADTLANGYALFVDEMEAKFHPNLTRALIALFQSPESNSKNAQLVFVTHDTNLLDSRMFRRDQIWFVEKDRYGASHLYSLAEFKDVRKEAAFEDEYLAGRYGAVPLIDDLPRVFRDFSIGEQTATEANHAA